MRLSQGTPFVGYVSLVTATPAALIPIYVQGGSATAYVLKTSERIALGAYIISTNDTAPRLIQLTDNSTTPKILASVYGVSTLPAAPVSFDPGIVRGIFGSNLKAVVAAVTAALTIEIMIYGYVVNN
jgi:hypothetical protein